MLNRPLVETRLLLSIGPGAGVLPVERQCDSHVRRHAGHATDRREHLGVTQIEPRLIGLCLGLHQRSFGRFQRRSRIVKLLLAHGFVSDERSKPCMVATRLAHFGGRYSDCCVCRRRLGLQGIRINQEQGRASLDSGALFIKTALQNAGNPRTDFGFPRPRGLAGVLQRHWQGLCLRNHKTYLGRWHTAWTGGRFCFSASGQR